MSDLAARAQRAIYSRPTTPLVRQWEVVSATYGFRSQAALGGLLGIVRERWGLPLLFLGSFRDTAGRMRWEVEHWVEILPGVTHASTEAEALVIALEAAP